MEDEEESELECALRQRNEARELAEDYRNRLVNEAYWSDGTSCYSKDEEEIHWEEDWEAAE